MRNTWLLVLLVALLLVTLGVGNSGARALSREQAMASLTLQTGGSGSLTLDGSGDYIAIPHAPEFVPSGGITIEVWVKRADPNRCESVLGKNYLEGIWLGFCTQKVRFYTHGWGTAQDGRADVPAGQWTHIAVTFDGTTRRYYINGYLDYEQETPGSLPFNTDELRIGSDVSWFGTGHDFRGNIAEVRIWNYARPIWEIRRDMHRKITQPTEGLVGVWHLQENAEEGFGRYTATLHGDAHFGGPSAPAYDSNPYLVPRLSTTPTVDGKCSPGEYDSAFWLTVWNNDSRADYHTYRPKMYVGATASDIYVCVEGLPYESTPQGLYFDGNNDGGQTADRDDYRILVRTDNGTVTIEKGDGSGGYQPATLRAEAKTSQFTEFAPSMVEYRISRSEITSSDGRFRLQFLRRYSLWSPTPSPGFWLNYDMKWPYNAHPTRPNVWPTFVVNDANIPPSDSRPPRVRLILYPGEEVQRGRTLTIRAEADDDVDLARVIISYPGGEKTCNFAGNADRTGVCTYRLNTSSLSPGWHSVSARAIDHRGSIGYSGYRTFFVRLVRGDDSPPRIFVRYQYQDGSMYDSQDDELPDKHDITFFATASDPDGIRSIYVEVLFDAPLPGSGQQILRFACFRSSGTTRTRVTCQKRKIINIGIVSSSRFVVARYRAIAKDMRGSRRGTPWQYLILTERRPDRDNDDLPDSVELRIGTSPSNPDTDRDTLIDGMEVLGVTPAGYVELPSLGANPLRKDVFLQIDYETGLRYSQADLDYFRNNLRRRGITLHIEQNERPPQTFDGRANCSEDLLFSITDSVDRFVSELDAEQISDALRNKFASEGWPLRPDARVLIIDGLHGKYWIIRSGTEQFVIRLRDNRLDILRGLSKVDIGAVEAAALRDAEGNYYFPPARNWTHLYVYVRHFDGRSFNWGRYSTVDGCWPDLQYRLIHEVGHALGLGHGGRSGPDAPQPLVRPHKYLVYYEGGWINDEGKPNYRSIMSYRYNGLLYFHPNNFHFHWSLDYSDSPLPTLNENALDESATAPFATQLRALPTPPDLIPVITYNCVDPDESDDKGPYKYLVATDGQRMVGRKRLARDDSERNGVWQFFRLPTQVRPGIDWNCDGFIGTRVSGDVDGDGTVRNRPMLARADYPFIPAGHPCNVLVLRDGSFPQPESYRRAIHGVQCSTSVSRSTIDIEKHNNILSPYVETNPPVQLPPDTELCDGRNNDGDNEIDEGCPDTDKDGVVDAIDNCPETSDATLVDRDNDGVGDICQYPVIDNFWIRKIKGTSVTLKWKGTNRDIGGYRIYRRRFDEPNFRYITTVTGATKYTDQRPDQSIYIYEVAVLNLNGVETDRASVATGTVRRMYIPQVLK